MAWKANDNENGETFEQQYLVHIERHDQEKCALFFVSEALPASRMLSVLFRNCMTD